jgi:hypothetical protein
MLISQETWPNRSPWSSPEFKGGFFRPVACAHKNNFLQINPLTDNERDE